LAAEATSLGLTVVGAHIQSVKGASAADLKASIAALKIPYATSASSNPDLAFDVLDFGCSLNDLTELEASALVADLEKTFGDAVRFHANASTFLQQQTHTLYLNVLAKEHMDEEASNNAKKANANGNSSGSSSSSSASTGHKRKKVEELSVDVSPCEFIYHVSTALAPHQIQQAKVRALLPRVGAPLVNAALLPLPAVGSPAQPVACMVSELNVGEWVSVSECATWCPSSFLAPHTNFKGQILEPATFYVFEQRNMQ